MVGARRTPPAVSAPPQDGPQGGTRNGLESPVKTTDIDTDMPWPPPGWPMFSCIVHDGGKAYYPARPGAPAPENDFLCYQVETRAPDQYTIEIMAGSVGTHGLRLNPVIGIRLSARPDGAEWFDDTAGDAIIDMHVRGQRLIPERAAILRVILATTFLISRIDRGIAPNLRRILRLYRLEK